MDKCLHNSEVSSAGRNFSEVVDSIAAGRAPDSVCFRFFHFFLHLGIVVAGVGAAIDGLLVGMNGSNCLGSGEEADELFVVCLVPMDRVWSSHGRSES